MQRLALVNNCLSEPAPGLKGTCRGCKGDLVSVCGPKVTNHWRHISNDDCDSWSETIGPWHLSWQGLVRSESVEVPLNNHRADIVGNQNIVIELQRSPIGLDDIQKRELFYGDMVWLFDATYRFSYLVSGELAFFSLGKTKHVNDCKKKVFLDFGDIFVEVVTLELKSGDKPLIEKCHGFGYVRSKSWFIDNYLSEVKKEHICLDVVKTDKKTNLPWAIGNPFRRMKFPTRWHTLGGGVEVVPEGKKYFPVITKLRASDNQPLYSEFILKFTEIGGDWLSVKKIEDMADLLSGEIVILRGRLCVIPSRAEYMQQSFPYKTTLGCTSSDLI